MVGRGILGRAARESVGRALQRPQLARLAIGSAGARGRGIALLWHRIRPGGAAPHEVVRSVDTAAFSAQLDLLEEVGEVVPLSQLETFRRTPRPRFALTFDDDDPGHVQHTLPILRARQLPATFFLSGRWREGLGPYWWEVLEEEIRLHGSEVVARNYGIAPDSKPVGLATSLTGTCSARELGESARGSKLSTMTAQDARELVVAGMEVGFHTLKHPSMPGLGEEQLWDAVSDGHEELAAEVAAAVVRFAYPHGRVDARVAGAVRAGGFVSAWTTARRVTRSRDDAMIRGRWDLGLLELDDFRAVVLRGLGRPGG